VHVSLAIPAPPLSFWTEEMVAGLIGQSVGFCGSPAVITGARLLPDRRAEITLDTPGLLPDLIYPDGHHAYWSTHCRHGNCGACAATELAPGLPRRPSQCKICSAPCTCECHCAAREAGVTVGRPPSLPDGPFGAGSLSGALA
jgi:hypothetical protein